MQKGEGFMNSIGYVDVASYDDTLGVGRYYRGLTEFIMKCPTPMTISIQGDWGGGKTTALNLIEQNLNRENQNQILAGNRKKYHVIWFRTWQYSKFGMDKNMILALMDHLCSKLEEVAQKKEIDLGDGVKKIIKKVIAFGTDRALGGEAAETVKNIWDTIFGMKYDPTIIRQIENAKAEIQKNINEIIKDEEERLVIFIDDLDRLEAGTAVELLEGIKNLLDCEKCVFVLAVDSSVIYQGIRSKYGEDFGKDKEKKFFDKIIQVPFSIPMNQYNMKSYLKKEFLPEEDENSIEGYANAIKEILGNNPRSIKRAFNRLELHKLILGDSIIKNQKDSLILFIILLIQMEEEDLYNNIIKIALQGDSVEMYRELHGEEYFKFRKVLNLPDLKETEGAVDGEEQWDEFINLIAETAQISENVSPDTKRVNTRKSEGGALTNILDLLEEKYTRDDLTALTINFWEGNNRRCCFREKKDKTNTITIYKVGKMDLERLTIDGVKEISEDYPATLVKKEEIGHYYHEDHVTLVGITEDSNEELLKKIMKFYYLL